eukprot:gene2341-2889_t
MYDNRYEEDQPSSVTATTTTTASPSQQPPLFIKNGFLEQREHRNGGNISPFSIGSYRNSPPISPITLSRRTPPLENTMIKEKIQHLGWIGSPQIPGGGRGRQRSNSVAIGSPGSLAFLQNQYEDLKRQMEEKEKDAQLAAEIGKLLLDRNQELEDNVLHLMEIEKKYQENSSQFDFLKNQNEILNGNLKEATKSNEILYEKLKEEASNGKNKKLSSHRSSNKTISPSMSELDNLHLEIEELRNRDILKDRNILKLKSEKEILLNQIEELKNSLYDRDESDKELVSLKEKNRLLSFKLKTFTDMNIDNSILDEFKILKSNFHLTLENLVNSVSKIEEFNIDQENKLINESRLVLDQIIIDESTGSIYTNLVNKLKELDIVTKYIDNKISNYDNDSNNNSDLDITVSDMISTTKESNFLNCSLFLIISIISISKNKELLERILKEKSKIQELTEDLLELNEKYQTSTKLNDRLELDQLSTSNQIESLKLNINELQKSLLDIESGKENEISLLKNEILGLKSKLTESNTMNHALESNVNSKLLDYVDGFTIVYNRTVDELESKIKSLEEDKLKMIKSIEELESTLKQTNESTEEKSVVIRELREKLGQSLSDQDNQRNSISNLELELETVSKDLKLQLESLNSQSKETIDRLNMEIQALQQSLRDQVSQSQVELEQLKQKDCEECHMLRDSLKSFQNEIDQIKGKECTECTILKDQLEVSIQKKQHEIEIINSKHCHESQLIQEEMKQQIDSLQSTLSLLQSKEIQVINESEERVNQMKLKIEEKDNELQKLITDNEQRVLEFENQRSESKQKIDTLSEQVETLKQQTASLSIIQDLQIENSQLKKLNLESDITLQQSQLILDQKDLIIRELTEKLEAEKSLTRDLEYKLIENQHQKELEIQQQQQQQVIIVEEPIILKKKEIEPTTKEQHICNDNPVSEEDIELIKYVNSILNSNIPTNCLICILENFEDGLTFCNLINHFIPDTIDYRALHKICSSRIEKIENISLALNSIKVYGGITSFSAESIVDLKIHPELAFLWKHNPEHKKSNDKEKWDNFITLEPPAFLRRWVNHFLKLENVPLITNFTNDFNDFKIINRILKHIYPNDWKSNNLSENPSPDSILEFIKINLNCGKIIFKHHIQQENPDEQKVLFLLAQLFHLNSGIHLSKDCPIEPDSPEIGPTSEEKACKVWLKTVDISATSLDDFRDGLLLLRALDKEVSPGIVNWKQVNLNPTNTFSMTENCNYCVSIGKSLRFSLVGIAGKDFVDGNKKFLMSFVWQMMRLSVLKRVNLKTTKNGKEITDTDLIAWANQKVLKSGKSSSMKSFGDSTLKDGIFLLDLLNSIQLGSIDYKEVQYFDNYESKKANAKYVISVARRLGCTAIIFWEDIVEAKPNMIMTFLCDLIDFGNNPLKRDLTESGMIGNGIVSNIPLLNLSFSSDDGKQPSTMGKDIGFLNTSSFNDSGNEPFSIKTEVAPKNKYSNDFEVESLNFLILFFEEFQGNILVYTESPLCLYVNYPYINSFPYYDTLESGSIPLSVEKLYISHLLIKHDPHHLVPPSVSKLLLQSWSYKGETDLIPPWIKGLTISSSLENNQDGSNGGLLKGNFSGTFSNELNTNGSKELLRCNVSVLCTFQYINETYWESAHFSTASKTY